MKTEGWLPIAKLEEQNKKHFDDEMKRLVETCDNYPDIAEFVRILVNGLLSDENSDDFRLADILSGFIWGIYCFDIRTSLTNPYHYRGNWAYELNSFIGNYFLDDLFFALTRDNYYHAWKASADNENGIQNPLALIAAAKDVFRFYRKLEGLSTGEERKQCMRDGMESSGEVERYLRKMDE